MFFKICSEQKSRILTKILTVMKLIVILLFSVVFQASAYSGRTQNVTYNFHKAKLLQVFNEIQRQTGYRFVFTSEMLNKSDRVDVHLNNIKLEEALDKILSGTPLTYGFFSDKVIIIKEKTKPVKSEVSHDIHTVAEILPIPLAPPPIKGRVLDENGKPVVGANIIVKGSQAGTKTDDNGEFEINLKEGDKTLVISYVGMETQTVSVKPNDYINAILKATAESQQDVVVIGYGSQKKATLTGAIATIKSDQIVTTKNEAIVNSLAGKIPGVIVAQNSSQPGTYDNVFNIRGLGNPLIVIDGVIQNDANVFYRLNANDIETISVLKDASAAVYGFRSANGVVLVTTKKGQTGKFALEYNGMYGFQKRSGVPLMADPVQYMTIANQMAVRAAGPAGGGLIKVYPDSLINLYKTGALKGTDWINLCMQQNAPQTQHTLSATGGNDKISFYSSISYLYQDGLFKNNALNYNKFSLTSNVTATLTDNLKVRFNLEGISDSRIQPYVDPTSFFSTVWNMNPIQTPYWGNNTNYPQQSWLDYGWNPLILMDRNIVGYKKFNNFYANALM
ncbi:MAG TPA: SusC/RagA family TonB-linked outer membrane protein, partial [Chitinophagaceae bacterium]|nr:SusC/RagA family TonB-linked outer membrane protein [Chitinophagaceae bacterium]